MGLQVDADRGERNPMLLGEGGEVRRGDEPHVVADVAQAAGERREGLHVAAGAVADDGDSHGRAPLLDLRLTRHRLTLRRV